MRTYTGSVSNFAGKINLFAAQILAMAVVLAGTSSAFAENVLYDSNGFETPTFTAGSTPIGQDGWIGLGGGPAAFAVETSKVASGKQAVVANGTGVNDASFAFPILGYAPSLGERVDIQVNMARTVSPHSGTGNPVYAIDIYNENTDRMARFGLIDNGGVINAFANGDNTQGPVISDDAVAANAFVHLEMILDFDSQTAQLYIDGQPIRNTPLPFLTSSFAIGAAALQIGSLSDQNDKGYFDNYFVGTLIAGDANRDGFVDGADYTHWADHFLQTGQSWDYCDFSGDGLVDGLDYTIWADHFSPQTALVAAVPEPSSVALMAMGALGLGLSRVLRKRKRD